MKKLSVIMSSAIFLMVACDDRPYVASTPEPTPSPEKVARLDKAIQTGINNGAFYSVEADYKTIVARVEPLGWISTNIDTKKEIILLLSEYGRAHGGNGTVTIKSSKNEDELATYSPGWGLSIKK